MKRVLVFVCVLCFAAVGAFAAGPPVSDSITVSASNAGVFTFDITAASYSFGTIDAAGTAASGFTAPAPTVATNASGAVYTATTASTWTSSSAPARTVRVFNASTTSTIVWGTANRLAIQIPTTNLGVGATSCGFITFGTTGDGGAGACASGNLVHSVAVGMNANSKTGNLDLQVTVDNTDTTGSNSWTVLLTATGA